MTALTLAQGGGGDRSSHSSAAQPADQGVHKVPDSALVRHHGNASIPLSFLLLVSQVSHFGKTIEQDIRIGLFIENNPKTADWSLESQDPNLVKGFRQHPP